MKKFLVLISLALIAFVANADQRQGKVYFSSADEITVASGGALTVASGGTLTVASGGTLAMSGTLSRSTVRVIPASIGHAGAGAGFTNAGNTGAALCPASQSAATFLVPITGLKIGDTVTAYKVSAQIESAGGTVTLDADLRKLTNAAGDPTDASIGAITQVSVTADTAVASSKTLSAAEVIASGETVYLLVTVTTAGSTDVQLLAVEVSVTEA
jgi:hypothetical protein